MEEKVVVLKVPLLGSKPIWPSPLELFGIALWNLVAPLIDDEIIPVIFVNRLGKPVSRYWPPGYPV